MLLQKKEVKTWGECKREAKWIIRTAEKRRRQINNISKEAKRIEKEGPSDEELKHYSEESGEGDVDTHYEMR